MTAPDESVVLGEVAAAEPPAVEALIAYAAGLAGDLTVQEWGAALEAHLPQRPSAANMYYARYPTWPPCWTTRGRCCPTVWRPTGFRAG